LWHRAAIDTESADYVHTITVKNSFKTSADKYNIYNRIIIHDIKYCKTSTN